MIALKLRNRLQNSHSSRDMTLTRAFMLLSISWMTLWAPLIIFKTVYGFVDRPDEFTISFGYVASSIDDDYDEGFGQHRKFELWQFVVQQIAFLFSTVNSVILIVVLRPYQEPLKKIKSKLSIC